MDQSKHFFVCPLCGELIEALGPEETRQAPMPAVDTSADTPLQAHIRQRIEQNVAANEAVLELHMAINHTMKEALLALGEARNALMDIREVLTPPGPLSD